MDPTAEFFEIVRQHPFAHLLEVARRVGRTIAWCEDKLHVSKLDDVCRNAVQRNLIRPLNIIQLVRLGSDDQHLFIQRAIRLAPEDFQIDVENHLRWKARQVVIPLLTEHEVFEDALKVVPAFKLLVQKFRDELEQSERTINQQRKMLRPSRDLDDM